MSNAHNVGPTLDLIDRAKAAGRYSTFVSALDVSGVAASLRDKGPFTLFAPCDDAFDRFPRATLDKLMQPSHRALLISVLCYHFAPGQVLARRFAGKRISAISFEGRKLLVDGTGELCVDGARVIDADVVASNGVLHGIERVLWPKFAAQEAAVPA